MELLHADQTATTKFVQPLMSEQEFVGDTEADFLEAIVKETLDGFTTNDDSNEEDGEEKSPVPSPVANAVAIVAVPNTSVSKKKKKSKYTPEERLERRRHQNRNSMRAKRENQKVCTVSTVCMYNMYACMYNM
jgi:hypothetical protein